MYAPGAPLPGEEEEGEAISFLKEQQWTLEFGTSAVAARGIRSSITVPATVQPRSGGDALLTAPVPGRIDPAAGVPVPGTRVRAGAMLARIAPRSDDLRDAAGLRAALVEAEQAHVLAAQERDRAERLVEARALPTRRLDEAKRRAGRRRRPGSMPPGSAGAGSSRSASRPTGTRRARCSPCARRSTASSPRCDSRPGASVEANEPLMRIVDPDRVHVVGAVPEIARGRDSGR